MIETKFKNTELGLFPEDWNVITIGELSSIVTGATPSTENPSYWGGEIRWMSSGELNLKVVHEVAGRITQDGYNASSTHMLPKNCVLIGLAGQGKTRGTAAINKIELCTNQSIAAILPSKKYNSEFLYHYIDNEYLNLRALSSGDGGRGGLTKSLLSSYQICIPSQLAEQEKIAEALADVDALVAELTALIEKKRSVLKGTMQELLTARCLLLGFSEPWEEVKLGDFVSIVRGGSPRPIEAYLTTRPDGLNWIKIGDTRVGDKYITHTDERIIPEGLSSTRQVHKGDLILSNSMSFGRPYILAIDGCIHDGWLAISKYEESFDTDFFYYLLQSEDTVKQYKMLAAGSGVLNLNKAIVGDVLVFKPKSIQEQRVIAEILSDMDAELVELEAKREKYKAVRHGMMQQLLTGKIRLI